MTKLEIIAEPGVPQILTRTEVNAPRDLVFRAYTEPELLVQWLGPRDLTMRVDRLENRDGGVWRFVHANADGHEFGFHGVIHGDPTPNRVVRTFEFEGFPGHVSMETLTLEGHGDRTVIRTNSVFQSVEDRDGMINAGMERGATDSMERLEALLARLAPVGA